MELINLAGLLLLALLIRKLVWCLRWLWCYYPGGRESGLTSTSGRRERKRRSRHVLLEKERGPLGL